MFFNFYLDGVVVFVSGISKYFLFFLNFRCKGNKNKFVISLSFNFISFCKFFCNFFGSLSVVVYMSFEDKLVFE